MCDCINPHVSEEESEREMQEAILRDKARDIVKIVLSNFKIGHYESIIAGYSVDTIVNGTYAERVISLVIEKL